MKKEALKKLGILGVSFGLVASPLAFAMEEPEEQPATPQEETMQDDQGTYNSYDTEQEQGSTTEGVTTEYEEEEQEFTYEEEEEELFSQEHAWFVVVEFFKEFKMVRQQIDSFDEFMDNTIQEIIDGQVEGPDRINGFKEVVEYYKCHRLNLNIRQVWARKEKEK